SGQSSAWSHPIAKQNHDRTIFIRIHPDGMQVDYLLALDEWTLARDLVPFSGDVDFAGDVKQLHQAFAKIYAPRIAQGLAARLDGRELKFVNVRHAIEIKDHVAFTFHLRAPLSNPP